VTRLAPILAALALAGCMTATPSDSEPDCASIRMEKIND
jgi:outer membrane PBP1 activator LpoA protein